jgi:hypothetical protein
MHLSTSWLSPYHLRFSHRSTCFPVHYSKWCLNGKRYTYGTIKFINEISNTRAVDNQKNFLTNMQPWKWNEVRSKYINNNNILYTKKIVLCILWLDCNKHCGKSTILLISSQAEKNLVTYLRYHNAHIMKMRIKCRCFVCLLAVLRLELIASHLLDKCSTAWVTSPVLFALIIFEIGSHFFAQAGLNGIPPILGFLSWLKCQVHITANSFFPWQWGFTIFFCLGWSRMSIFPIPASQVARITDIEALSPSLSMC